MGSLCSQWLGGEINAFNEQGGAFGHGGCTDLVIDQLLAVGDKFEFF